MKQCLNLLHDAIVDEEDNTRLLATYQALLAYKPTERDRLSICASRLQSRSIDRDRILVHARVNCESRCSRLTRYAFTSVSTTILGATAKLLGW